MTVREVLDFAARCQGIGSRAGLFYSHLIATVIIHKTRFNLEAFATTDIMKEVTRREKQEGIVPDSDVDTYMKVWARFENRSFSSFPLCIHQFLSKYLENWTTGHFHRRVEKISHDRLHNKGTLSYQHTISETKSYACSNWQQTFYYVLPRSLIDPWARHLCWDNCRGSNAKRNFRWPKEKVNNR